DCRGAIVNRSDKASAGPNRDASEVDCLDGLPGRDVSQRDADVEISIARARRAVESLRDRDGKAEIRSTRSKVDSNHIREVRRTGGRCESGERDRDDEKSTRHAPAVN